MAQNKKFDLVFFIVMALAIMLLVYLSVNITNRAKSFDEIVKLSGTLILPIPLALFAMYTTAGRKRKLDYSDKKEVIIPVVLFIAGVGIILLCIQQIEKFTHASFEENIVAPTLINSAAILAFAVNYITINHPRISGAVCGLLFGLALYIFVF